MKIILIDGCDKRMEDAFFIRNQVFVQEQKVPEEMERDEIDLVSKHILLIIDGQTVGTGRVFVDPYMSEMARMGRIAVLNEFRGQGLGKVIVDELIGVARNWGCRAIKIHSQTQVEKMYEKAGFVRIGEEFDEAGISHVEMILDLNKQDTVGDL